MIRAAAALMLVAGTAVSARDDAMHHATGSFEVTITPEAQGPALDGGLPTSRMALHKVFSGGLAGEATGTMLAAGTPGPGKAAAYVALDQVTGTLYGHAGGFVLIHRGTITKAGIADLQVTIAPDSGTGALTGIAGSLTIDPSHGDHHYDLAYTMPAPQ